MQLPANTIPVCSDLVPHYVRPHCQGARLHPNAIGLSRKHILEGLRASLERMGLDYVDLVYCHREDPQTPIEVCTGTNPSQPQGSRTSVPPPQSPP